VAMEKSPAILRFPLRHALRFGRGAGFGKRVVRCVSQPRRGGIFRSFTGVRLREGIKKAVER
jgi:hypothetical protein